MYKPYQNKSSLRKSKSRYIYGGVSENVGDKIGWWERAILPKSSIDDITIKIDNVYNKRPDLISYDYYGTTEYEWLVLQYNNIVDINEELVYGKSILLPVASRIATFRPIK